LKNSIKICFILSLIFSTVHLFSQNTGEKNKVIFEYLNFADNQSVLYYGNVQEGHQRATNHPYLKDNQYVKTRLSYHQIIYPEAMLRLDLSRNELVILSPTNLNIVLFPENVDYAEMHDLLIIYYRNDSLPGSPSTGYYTLLHSGNCKVMEKQTATRALVTTSNTHTQEHHYVFRNYIYLYKDGTYYTIRNKRGLLNVLSPHKKELKQFISTNNLKFRRNADNLIVQTVREYEKLSGSL